MPAIQPVRLKTQVIQLAEQFIRPAEFTRCFTELMEAYADRTHRSGQTGEPPPMLPSYNPPAPVLRQIWVELLPSIDSRPLAALELCDTLWKHPSLEHRSLAAEILGQLPITYQKEVLERVQSWAKVEVEERLVNALLDRSLYRLRSQSQRVIAEIVERWLSSPDLYEKQLGLRLLASMASDSLYDDLPVIFRLISPFLRIAPRQLRPDIIKVLDHLISRSPQEAAFLLQKNLSASENPDTAWLIRQVILHFPAQLQIKLRKMIKRS